MRGAAPTVVLANLVVLVVLVAPAASPLVAQEGSTAGVDFAVCAAMRDFTPPVHGGPRHFAGACRAMADVGKLAFVVSPGDVSPPDRVRASLAAALGPAVPWYPAVGGHDAASPSAMVWLRTYNARGDTLPNVVMSGPPNAVETQYGVEIGDVHLAVLNQYFDGTNDAKSGRPTVTEGMLSWLDADLSATRSPFVFVAGHGPLVVQPDMQTGRRRHIGQCLDANPRMAVRLMELLSRHGVTAYLCGHTHNASYSKVSQFWQIDCGHARGDGDTGAPSTFVVIRCKGDLARCEFWRQGPEQDRYERTAAVMIPRGRRP